jgi:N-hydroxyarylamine O-acetyltransferase
VAESKSIDLGAYLARIRVEDALEPSLSVLEKLHTGHLARIPFENIDVRLRRPVGLDLESLEAKMVRGGRGGYCFEQNTLFAAVLRALGFEVRTLEARVRPPGVTATLPRTHMLLQVDVAGRAWIADVGFGAHGPLFPVLLDGTASEQPDGAYRVERETRTVNVLRRRWRGAWQDLYAFSLAPALPVDFDVAHHYTSTHPSSAFVRTLTVQLAAPEARQILRGRTHTVQCANEETMREIEDAELPSLLRDEFGLRVTDEDALLALGEP